MSVNSHMSVILKTGLDMDMELITTAMETSNQENGSVVIERASVHTPMLMDMLN